MRRFFVPLAAGQVHCRRSGRGRAVVLLPPLPRAGDAMRPLAERLARSHEVLIVDPPGYGLSDPPDAAAGDDLFEAYGRPVLDTLRRLGVERFGLVGIGVGAVLALTLGRAGPDRVTRLVVDFDGATQSDPTQAAEAEFPAVAPRRDGGHLLTLWDMERARGLFAPWHAGRATYRLTREPPDPAAVHEALLDDLRAGEGYAKALRAARRLDVDALLHAQARPPLILREDVVEDAAGQILDLFQDLDASIACAPAEVEQASPGVARLQNAFLDVAGGQVLARLDLSGDGAPLVGLHDPAGSSRRLTGVLAPLIGRRPVVALDLPGSGESDRRVDDGVTIARYADEVGLALDALGVDRCDVLGRYSGGQVGLELSLQRGERVRRLIHFGVQIFAPDETPRLRADYAPSLAPRWDGAHLVTAWAILRDMSLFWPWFDRSAAGIVWRDADIDAASLHSRVVDLLKMGELWRSAYAASFDYPMRERLAAATVPMLFADLPGAASHSRLAIAARATPNGRAVDLVGPPSDWAAAFEAFLDAQP